MFSHIVYCRGAGTTRLRKGCSCQETEGQGVYDISGGVCSEAGVEQYFNKSKPITMRQVALESALHHDSRSPSPEPLPHVEEQRALRDETIAAFHHALDGDKDEDDGLLVPREKTKDEREREEEEYRAFLEREVGEELKDLVTVDESGLVLDNPEGEDGDIEVKDGENKMKKKKKEKAVQDTKPKGEADQEFLMKSVVHSLFLR